MGWNSLRAVGIHHLVDVGFKQSVHDPCVYTRGDAILAVHVDDIIVATDGVQKMKQVKREFAGPFDVRDLGEVKHFVGVTMDQGQDGTWIGQPTYTRNVLEKYNMQDAKAVATPVDTSRKLTEADDGTCDSDTVADMLTKGLCREKYAKFRNMAGVMKR